MGKGNVCVWGLAIGNGEGREEGGGGRGGWMGEREMGGPGGSVTRCEGEGVLGRGGWATGREADGEMGEGVGYAVCITHTV